ncbi:MAG TPA: hypothetical protein VGD17_14980 [Chitinophagaceae bacterium]
MHNTVKILEVQMVELTVYKTFPPTLAIDAYGVVPTPGYKNPRLIPWIYIQPPPDGIWDFDFIADEPDGIVPQVLSPISATYYWAAYPQDLKGVRIHAVLNSKEGTVDKTNPREIGLMKDSKR